MAIKQNRILFSIIFTIVLTSITAQTTFTESAASYGLNIGGTKDGGHAWADYDLDGDFDLVINTNGRGYLLRNDGGSFTDVTNINGNLAPDFLNGSLERTALFVDFNNDGYPDIFRNTYNDIKIYLQDPVTHKFGDGLGGTAPNQRFNGVTSLVDGQNTEGAGALDYDGDGDLDLFVDNHNFGIDILQNDGTGFFTQVTKKSDSPNPPYNAGDSTTWPLGLAQDATDGDYGSATDYNNDGWVDVVVRKRNQADLFTNLGGTFGNEINIDDANNSNKGSVAFQDFDNDGDFDLYWTEATTNQIHRNNGDGTWTALGSATGIPVNFSGQIEGLACGDVDNDGDIDIYLGNGGTGSGDRSKLYLNQINNGGGAMNFIDSGLTFNNRNEGSTFIDIDNDGDLDLYVNKNNVNNELWINNLGAAAQANHLYIDIIEDRDSFGLINTEQRFGVGATATILDCSGNVISGIREVNGGYGHGTQEPGVIHFGLPGGPNTPIVVEVSYPRTTTGRIVVRQELTPSSFFNGSVNLVTVLPTSGNQAPIANDDIIYTNENNAVNFDPLVDNGNNIDSDPDGHPISVISVTQPANGTAVLNGDGTITYTPDPGFFGNDPFTYTIEDDTGCTLVNIQSIGNIMMTVNRDTDDDGIADVNDLDDDNDGIFDTVESDCALGFIPVNSPGYPLNSDFSASSPLVDLTAYGGVNMDLSYVLQGTATWSSGVRILNNGAISPDGDYVNLQPRNTNYQNGDVAIYTLDFNSVVSNLSFKWGGLDNGDISKFDAYNGGVRVPVLTSNITNINIPAANFSYLNSNTILSTNASGNAPNNSIQFTIQGPVDKIVITVGKNGANNNNITLQLYEITYCLLLDTDGDSIPNHQDLDSDGDGCFDTVEAGFIDPDADGILGTSPVSVDANGQVTGQGGYSPPADLDSNSVSDFLESGPDSNGNSIADGCEVDLSLTKIVDNAFPDQGVDITFTITIGNNGPSPASNIVMTDIIPIDFAYTDPNYVITQGSVTFNPVSRAFEWDLGNYILSPGSSITLTYTVTVSVCGEFNNQAEITNISLTDLDSTPNNGG